MIVFETYHLETSQERLIEPSRNGLLVTSRKRLIHISLGKSIENNLY